MIPNSSPLNHLDSDVIEFIVNEISGAGGKEVLFCGTAGKEGLVTDVKVLSRGNSYSAPAILKGLASGSVLIHNHPSGNLDPSDEDIAVASIAGNAGAGFYIVNNELDNIYILAPPFRSEKKKYIDIDHVLYFLRDGSKISRSLKGYEERAEQLDMAVSVSETFNDDKIALIEAGTGVGKSMAYLVPSVLWAVSNKERVLISTNTINLQEQLIYKDIPFIHDNVCSDFKAILVKGRGNYACKKKAARLGSEGGELFEDQNIAEERSLVKWMEKSKDGCRSDLNFVPRASSWGKIVSEADLCGKARCSYYKECFFYMARREAASADIMVVNHHLLFADLAVKGEKGGFNEGAVLPPYSRVILDEAHNIEDVATEYFGASVSKRGMELLLGRMVSKKDSSRGLLPYICNKIAKKKGTLPSSFIPQVSALINEKIIPSIEYIRSVSSEFFDVTAYLSMEIKKKEAKAEEQKRDIRVRIWDHILSGEEWLEVKQKLADLLRSGRQCAAQMKTVARSIRDVEDKEWKENIETLVMELNAYTERLLSFLDTVESFFFMETEGHVKWIDISDKIGGMSIRFNIAPVSVAEMMNEKVYSNFKSAVLTSATLSVKGGFAYFKERTGLEKTGERLKEKLLLSPFDFKAQVFLGIPTDMPLPGDKGYEEVMIKAIADALYISEGRAFVLFTSYNMMNKAFREISGDERLSSYPMMLQGEGTRNSLIKRFREDERSVLFGSDSFWEGVDVQGDSLMSVILTKLPFNVPDDPLVQARNEMIEKNGGNPFMDYVLPEAVLKFKQGFGRLIRSKSDRGAVLILDSRIARKSYGGIFVKSLPQCRVMKSTFQEVSNELNTFFYSLRKN